VRQTSRLPTIANRLRNLVIKPLEPAAGNLRTSAADYALSRSVVLSFSNPTDAWYDWLQAEREMLGADTELKSGSVLVRMPVLRPEPDRRRLAATSYRDNQEEPS
jgi:hypothetical protein